MSHSDRGVAEMCAQSPLTSEPQVSAQQSHNQKQHQSTGSESHEHGSQLLASQVRTWHVGFRGTPMEFGVKPPSSNGLERQVMPTTLNREQD